MSMHEESLPDIILLTHGSWGVAVLESAEMIVGPIRQMHVFPLMPDQSFVEYIGSIERFIETVQEGSIIVADMFRGSTFNAAAVLNKRHHVPAMTGLDIMTIIQADELRKSYKGNELIDTIITLSGDNFKNISKLEISC